MVVNVTTIEGGNDVEAIAIYLYEAWENWDLPPSAVLLFGDYSTNGNEGITSDELSQPSSSGNLYFLSDLSYSGFGYPTMWEWMYTIARMPATASEIEDWVDKIIDFESNPNKGATYFDQPLVSGIWGQWYLGWYPWYPPEDMWNVMTDEIIARYWENEEGKTVAREYTTQFHYGAVFPGQSWSVYPSVENVLWHYGDESPVGLGYIDSDGLTSEVVYAIMDDEPSADFINDHLNNNGSFLVTFRGRGDVDGWYANYAGWAGYPEYTEYVISDLAGLENGTNYFYCISMATWNGKFNHTSDCFAEALTAMEGGSIGVLAPTGALYRYWDDLYTWGFVANMFPNFDPDYHYNNAVPFEGITTKCPGFALFSGIDYMMSGGAWMYSGSQANAYKNAEMIQYLGDPFSFMYTEVPQNLTVTHDNTIPYNATSTPVTANDGSFIAITYSNSILGTAVGTGSPVNVPLDFSSLPPQYVRPFRVLLTVTKPNYYRYTDYIYLGCYLPTTYEIYTPGEPIVKGVVMEDYNSDDHPDLGLVFLDSDNNTYVGKYSNEDVEDSYTFAYDEQLRYDQGLQAYAATTCKTRPSASIRDMVVGYQDRIAFIDMANGNTSWFTGYSDEVKSFSRVISMGTPMRI